MPSNKTLLAHSDNPSNDRRKIMTLQGHWKKFVWIVCFVALTLAGKAASAADLDQIREAGVLRHIGIPYANFVTGHGDGLDVELMKLFAAHLGVEYQFVQTDWGSLFGDLTGKKIQPDGDSVKILGETEVRGDIIANGLTRLAWREKIVNYSIPTFPTQVWCIARSDSALQPIKSSGSVEQDIAGVKSLLNGLRIMGKNGTCLAPGLYGIDSGVATVINFPGSLNDMAPAIIKGDADVALLDVPDSLVALGKWPGRIKVIGPLSPRQTMGVGFRKDSPKLLAEFNAFFTGLKKSGEYAKMVRKYYPAVFQYYTGFFGD